MTPERIKELKLFANKGRKHIIEETHAAKSGHPGGSLGAMDYMTYLYNEEMRVDPKNPEAPDRDRFVLSKGHCAPGLYSVLAQLGFFPEEDLLTIRKIGSYLQGHPNMNSTPGVDFSTGSLGQGYSAACGMANAAKVMKKDINIHALLGDGEIEEGLVWEASEYAAHYKLDNLCIAVDVNGLQIDGLTRDVMNMEPIDEKFASFGFRVIQINGADYNELEKAFAFFHEGKGSGKPTVILMTTIKGLGVSYMENQAGWHGKGPNDEECAKALAELEAVRKMIESDEERGTAYPASLSLEIRTDADPAAQ
ncbi:MAG: transketolase [Eubacteriales bacterium]|nr:transketolase [Eubacteriales bacterium]